MSVVLSLTIPFFALIFLGMICRRVGFVGPADARTLSRFAFFVAMPVMVFVKIGAGNAVEILNWGFIWRYELATVIIFVGAAFLARPLFRLTRLEGGMFGLNAAYPNYGYIGVPLAILAFGDAAALPMAVILALDTVVLLVLTGYFVAAEGGALGQTVWRALKTVSRNPLLISAVLGLAFAATGLSLPPVVDVLLNMLSDAAPPTALFALGATVYGQPIRRAFGELSAISVARLVIHPLMVAGFFLLLPGVDPLWVKTAILTACLPIAANAFVMSDHYGGYAGRTASAVFITTIIASATVPATLYLLFLLP
ncbi:MAG: AEC family transporter [Pseudomonadota bacterium]|nr:AEC family transporter [Pseudomonadota bacterium]